MPVSKYGCLIIYQYEQNMCIYIIWEHREFYINGFSSAYTLKGHSVTPAVIFSRRSSKIIVEERDYRIFLFKYIHHQHILKPPVELGASDIQSILSILAAANERNLESILERFLFLSCIHMKTPCSKGRKAIIDLFFYFNILYTERKREIQNISALC